jgi:hypothetical protein
MPLLKKISIIKNPSLKFLMKKINYVELWGKNTSPEKSKWHDYCTTL